MNRVRIVGGRWRSRLIVFPDRPGLRPTPDRVRETVFNWLGQDLSGLTCLDLFAGSGALGLESASRGAEWVTLVENDPRASRALREASASLGAERVEVVQSDALEFVRACSRRYDVVFLDPPFGLGWIERVAGVLPGVTTPDALIYVEAEHPVESLGPWAAVRHRRAGQVNYQLLRAVGT